MKADPNYRPGNLIIGGCGVGVRKAPPEAGIGEVSIITSSIVHLFFGILF